MAGAGHELVCWCGPVEALTVGDGNDTEAVWSPDGTRIAFQTDRKGDSDLAVLDLTNGKVKDLVDGPGHACYPAWTSDGGLVYAFGQHVGTAMQAVKAKTDYGTGLWLWKADTTRALTQGGGHDYTPSVTPDGAGYFASTRGNTGNSAALWRLSLAPGAAAECVLPLDGGSVGAVQPSLSPDGRILLWAQMDGLWHNWRVYASPASACAESLALTPAEMSAYAPRWSPDGRFIAFTGFRAGDPGWGVYVLEPRSGALGRLETGPGNSRSACWSPDGREVVFENNRTGVYKLYRTQVTCAPVAVRVARADAPTEDRVEARLEVSDGQAAVLVAADGNRLEGVRQGERALGFERPGGLDFGTGPFFVRLALVIDRHERDTRIAAVGNYAEHALGWQVFVRENRKLCFNARQPDGTFVGVESDAELKPGKPVSVLGIRDGDGSVRLYVDGRLQRQRAAGATLSYGAARRVCLGQQWNGGMTLNGRVTAFECGRGYPAGVPRVMTRDLLFGEVRP